MLTRDPTHDEVRELLPALSLDAVDQDERDVLEHHLARCEACSGELATYAETAAHIGCGMAQAEPRADLGRRIVAAATSGSTRPKPIPIRRRDGLLGAAGIPRFVAALAVVLAIGSLFWASSLQKQLDEQRAIAASNADRAQRYDRIVPVLQADQLYVRPLTGTDAAPGGSGRVYVDQASGQGMMIVSGVPPLSGTRSYQLWVVTNDGQRTSCGLVQRTDTQGNGYTLIQAPIPVSEWQRFGVTEEPVSGSPGPTGARILGGSI